MLRALLIAITVAGVSVPHALAGEITGSVPTLVVGTLVGLGCLRLGLGARTWSGRAVSVSGLVIVALAPLIAYLAQEAAEGAAGLEGTHAELGTLATILTQAPLIVLTLLVARLLVAAVRTVMGALRRHESTPTARRAISVAASTAAALLPARVGLVSSHGGRAPPPFAARYRMAPLG